MVAGNLAIYMRSMYKKFHQELVRHLSNRAAFDSSTKNVAKWLHLVLLSHSLNVCDNVKFMKINITLHDFIKKIIYKAFLWQLDSKSNQ